MPQASPVPMPLIEALIAGLSEQPLWAGFVARLRETLAADYASIIFRPAGTGTPYPALVHLFAGADSPPPVSRRYRERLHRLDPLPYHALRAGRVYALPELLLRDDPQHEAYRRELLAPSGMNYLRIMRFEEAGGGSGWLSASRRTRDFGPADDALIAALAAPLGAALTAHVARDRERMQAAVAGEAMRRLNFGWMTLDATGRILDADGDAEAMLDAPAARLVRDARGFLAASDADVARAIAESLATTGRAGRRTRAVVLCRAPWTDMLIVPLAPSASAVGHAPSVAIYVHRDRSSDADRRDHLGALFGLTPSEAGLALALSRGMSIAEAAVELGLTIGSARTYTKRIYSKTGARGQADLIRFIHRSVTGLA